MATGARLLSVQSSMGNISGVAQDAVVCTGTRGAVLGSSLMIFDLGLLPGNPLLSETHMGFRPRDLEITPDGSLLVVRGGHPSGGAPGGMGVFDLASGGSGFNPSDGLEILFGV
jgi:hypothetical protein